MTAACPEGCWSAPLPANWTDAMLQLMTCPDCGARVEAV